MPQVARTAVKERAGRLRAKGEIALRQHLDTQVGTTRRVLAELSMVGRTAHFAQVRLARPVKSGIIFDVPVKAHDGQRLFAA